MKKTLTIRYVMQQVTYWATAAAVVSFASAFLLEKGFSASIVGILLASGNLLSCAAQPFLAEWADRKSGNTVKYLIILLSLSSIVCFASIQMVPLVPSIYGIFYLLGVFTFDAMMPLLNAIIVRYEVNGYRINYGVGRGIGALAFSLSALLVGKIMATYGADWMPWIALICLLLHVFIVFGYPNLTDAFSSSDKANECCTVLEFFKRYKWYCTSLLGVMLLAMFHAMTENYLIEIVKPLGGDSNTVGIALFIATAAEMLVLLYFDRVRMFISDNWLLKLSGIFFFIKSIFFLLAPNVTTIYVAQLLQVTTYCFLSPTQLYYANNKISAADMVKGQAFITASYSLGCAIGNFAGGQLLHFSGRTALLYAGILMTILGTLILFLTVNKNDIRQN